MESTTVPSAGFDFSAIPTVRSSSSRPFIYFTSFLRFPLRLIQSTFESYKILRKFKPQIVVGTGGHASFPVCFAAVNKIRFASSCLSPAGGGQGSASSPMSPCTNMLRFKTDRSNSSPSSPFSPSILGNDNGFSSDSSPPPKPPRKVPKTPHKVTKLCDMGPNDSDYRFIWKNEAYSKDVEPVGGNLCLLDWSFAGCNRSSNPYMVATDLLCSISRMLWSINGWYWANAASYLSPRSTSIAAGYCRGQGLLQAQRSRYQIRLIQWLTIRIVARDLKCVV